MYVDYGPADYADGGLGVLGTTMSIFCIVLPVIILGITVGPKIAIGLGPMAVQGCNRVVAVIGFVVVVICIILLCWAGAFITGDATVTVH